MPGPAGTLRFPHHSHSIIHGSAKPLTHLGILKRRKGVIPSQIPSKNLAVWRQCIYAAPAVQAQSSPPATGTCWYKDRQVLDALVPGCHRISQGNSCSGDRSDAGQKLRRKSRQASFWLVQSRRTDVKSYRSCLSWKRSQGRLV